MLMDIYYKWNNTIYDFFNWLLLFNIILSACIYVAEDNRSLFYFLLNNISLYVYTTFYLPIFQSMRTCLVSTFWLIMNAALDICYKLWLEMFWIILSICLEVKSLGYMIIPCLIFDGLQNHVATPSSPAVCKCSNPLQ